MPEREPDAPPSETQDPPAPGTSDYWLSLFGKELSGEETARGLDAGREALRAALGDDGTRHDLREIFTRRLSGPPTMDTWDELQESVVGYLGPDAGYYLMSALSRSGTARPHIEQDPALMAAFDRLRGFHSVELDEAWERWQEHPDDWRSTRWDFYDDLAEQLVELEFVIIKYSGESFTLRSQPDSLVRLARSILLSLSRNPRQDALSEEALGEVDEILGRLRDARAGGAADDSPS